MASSLRWQFIALDKDNWLNPSTSSCSSSVKYSYRQLNVDTWELVCWQRRSSWRHWLTSECHQVTGSDWDVLSTLVTRLALSSGIANVRSSDRSTLTTSMRRVEMATWCHWQLVCRTQPTAPSTGVWRWTGLEKCALNVQLPYCLVCHAHCLQSKVLTEFSKKRRNSELKRKRSYIIFWRVDIRLTGVIAFQCTPNFSSYLTVEVSSDCCPE